MELEPCPFCGSYDVVVYETYTSGYAHCRGCGAEGSYRYSYGEAVEAWNRRTDERDSMRLPLDADGVPFRVGDEVFRLVDDMKLYVSAIEFTEEGCLIMAKAAPNFLASGYTANVLRHKKQEPADSREKLEEELCKEGMQRDLVRRCKEVAAASNREHGGIAGCSVNIGEVATFPNVLPGKEQALKVLEEAAEVFGACQAFNADQDGNTSAIFSLLDECADVIQAVSNLVASLNVVDFAPYMDDCRERNEKRGRFDG